MVFRDSFISEKLSGEKIFFFKNVQILNLESSLNVSSSCHTDLRPPWFKDQPIVSRVRLLDWQLSRCQGTAVIYLRKETWFSVFDSCSTELVDLRPDRNLSSLVEFENIFSCEKNTGRSCLLGCWVSYFTDKWSSIQVLERLGCFPVLALSTIMRYTISVLLVLDEEIE